MNFIYLILSAIFGYIYWKLDRIVWNKYYNSNSKNSFLATEKIPVAIFYPKPFFKKKNFLRGYLLYLLSWINVGLSLYFLFKSLGILQ